MESELSVAGGPRVRIRFPPAESPCLTQTRPRGSAAWRSARGVLADELLHPLDRRGGVGGVGFTGHEAVIGAFVELQFGIAARLVVVGDKAPHQLDRNPFVLVAAEDESRRQLAFLAALQHRWRRGVFVRRLGEPERVVQMDELLVAGLFREVVAEERVENAPARDHPGLRRINAGRAGLVAAFEKGGWDRVTSLLRRGDVPEEQCWLKGPDWCLVMI